MIASYATRCITLTLHNEKFRNLYVLPSILKTIKRKILIKAKNILSIGNEKILVEFWLENFTERIVLY